MRYQFYRPSPRVLTAGTYLARRWEENDRLMLYYLPDGACSFFIELGHAAQHGRGMVLRSFSDSAPLADYAYGVELPGQ